MEHTEELNSLKLFKVVCEQGSITKASTFLGIPKSRLSREMVKLEELLEKTLLHRSPKGIELTSAGKELLAQIQAPLNQLELGLRSFKGQNTEGASGTIRLTLPEDFSTAIMPAIYESFAKSYPHIRIEVIVSNAFLDFTEFGIDLALRVGKLQDSALIQKKIADIKLIGVASTDYLKSSPILKKKEDLEHHRIGQMITANGQPLFETIYNDYKSYYATSSFLAIKEMVVSSQVVSILPSFICRKEMEDSLVEEVLPEHRPPARSLYLLSRAQKFIPNHVKIFKQFLSTELQKILV